MTEELESEIKDKLPTKTLVKKSRNCYVDDEGRSLFVKINKTLNGCVMLDGELESLRQIEATNTIRVPKQYCVLHNYDNKYNSAIVLEYLDMQPLDSNNAKVLAYNLANLHDYNNKLIRYKSKSSKWIGGVAPSAKPLIKQKLEQLDNEGIREDHDEEDDGIRHSKHQIRFADDKTSRPKINKKMSDMYTEKFIPQPHTEAIHEFGFDVPTSCGVLPQMNNWSSNWVEFYSRNRLDHQIRLLLSNHGDRDLIEQWSHLQLKVDKFFTDYSKDDDEHIVPSLLHGDLWSGNVGQLKESSDESTDEFMPVIYDPSSFYGHSEYDFGIARMFGGIPESFEESYFELMPKKKLFEKRNKLYQLFHHLNHWNHFGYGYRNSSIKIIKDLNAMIN